MLDSDRTSSAGMTLTTKNTDLHIRVVDGDSTITTALTAELIRPSQRCVIKTLSLSIWSSRYHRRGGTVDNKPKHHGEWKKKEYSLGRYFSGGFWTCCGENEQIAFPCNEAMRERWKRSQDEADAIQAANVVKRAIAIQPEWPYTDQCKHIIIRQFSRVRNGVKLLRNLCRA